MKTNALVQVDSIGLFVAHDEWISRPIDQTLLNAGDDVFVEQFKSLAIGIWKVDDPTSLPVDVFLRCGNASLQTTLTEKRECFDFFQRFKSCVADAKTDIQQGRLPEAAGDEQTVRHTPQVVRMAHAQQRG